MKSHLVLRRLVVGRGERKLRLTQDLFSRNAAKNQLIHVKELQIK
jgi:hypothetical protein